MSMSARREITKKHAAEYAKASKTAKGVMLDRLVLTTGWSRANARRALTAAVKRKGTAKAVKRKPRPPTYGYDTLKLLIQVWNLSGRPSGKYLSATMGIWLPKLEKHHELDEKRLTEHTRAQLLAVSGATIDRMLKPTRDGGRLVGLSGRNLGLCCVTRSRSAGLATSTSTLPGSLRRIWYCIAGQHCRASSFTR